MATDKCILDEVEHDDIKTLVSHKEGIVRVAAHADHIDNIVIGVTWATRTVKVIKFIGPWIGSAIGLLGLFSEYLK